MPAITQLSTCQRIGHGQIPHIKPVDGWQLCSDNDGQGPIEHAVVRGGEYKLLGTSRWTFTPTQERFAWLVRNGFPHSLKRANGVMSPIGDADIDAALAVPVAA